MQKSLDFPKTLKPISDAGIVRTYRAWKRLIELKTAIIELVNSMEDDINRDIREDGRKLKKILLKDYNSHSFSKVYKSASAFFFVLLHSLSFL